MIESGCVTIDPYTPYEFFAESILLIDNIQKLRGNYFFCSHHWNDISLHLVPSKTITPDSQNKLIF